LQVGEVAVPWRLCVFARDLLFSVGFFEDFFDGHKRAVRTFWRVVNDQLTAATAR
jgi:hypothetical protein